MARGSQFWGTGRGKLGEQVLYRAGGEQRARAYVAKIKNPKTELQAVNRLSMRNFSSAFRAMKSIIRDSFPNRPVKESGYNAFVKANKTAQSAAITPHIASLGYFVPKGMTISKGNLVAPSIPTFWAGLELEMAYFGFVIDKIDTSLPEVVAALSTLGIEESNLSENGSLPLNTAEKVKAAFTLLGLPSNAVLTCVVAEYQDEAWQAKTKHLSTSALQSNFYFCYAMNEICIGIRTRDEQKPTSDDDYYALLVSYKSEGKLDVSTASFVTWSDSTRLADSFCRGGDVYEEILSDYVQGKESVLEA